MKTTAALAASGDDRIRAFSCGPIRAPAPLLPIVGLLLVLAAPPIHAATNQATGDVSGDPAALVDSNVFVLNSTGNRLGLVKRAFLPDGTPVSSPSTLPTGSAVQFLLYINNDSAEPIHDIGVRDVLDPAFVYQSASIRVDNSVSCAASTCTALEEAAILAAVDGAAVLSDAIDGNVASYNGGATTVHLGNEVEANAQLNIAANAVWAARFTVSMPATAASAVNQATGGITGLDNGSLTGGDGSGEAQRTITATQLALVKQARLTNGTVLAGGSDVLPGQEIYFVLFVDNTTGYPVSNLGITDAIDETQFTYVDDSLEMTSVPTGSDDATIWAGAWGALTDTVSAADEGSAADTGGPAGDDRVTFGAVVGQVNQTVDVPASTLIAIRFRVTVN